MVRSRLVVATCALVVVGLIGVVAAVAVSRGSASPVVGLGRPLDVPGLRVVVTKVRTVSAIDLGNATVRPSGRFVLLQVTLTNTTTHARQVPNELFRLMDDTGTAYLADSVTNRLQNGAAWGVTAAPGTARTLLLAFDVDPSSDPAWLDVAALPKDTLDLPTGDRYVAAGRVRLK